MKWEYKVIQSNGIQLDKFGRDGWEVITVFKPESIELGLYEFWMKRELTEQSDSNKPRAETAKIDISPKEVLKC